MKIFGHQPHFTAHIHPERKNESLPSHSPPQNKQGATTGINLGFFNIRREKHQQAKLTAQISGNASGADKEEMMKKLIGVAINPQKITRKMMESIDFDGVGRIQGFRKDVKPEMLKLLLANQVKSLTEVHSSLAEDIPKSGRGCMVELMDALKNSPSHTAKELTNEAKRFWLNGKFDSNSVSRFLDYANSKLSGEPQLQALAGKLKNAVQQPKVRAQFNDNVHGRKFETEFINELVKNPPHSVLMSAYKTGNFLLNGVENMARTTHPAQLNSLLQTFANNLRDDPRPWAVKTPEIQAFVNNPTIENLRPLLGKVQNGFDAIKIPYLAVKFSLAAHATNMPAPWMQGANYNYAYVVGAARTTKSGKIKNANDHNGFGLRLHHHPKNEPTPEFQNGKNWTTEKIHNLSKPTAFEINASLNENTVVNGVSGSTNIMAFLNDHISRSDPSFSKEHGLLNTMMFVVYDGGHSINEVMAVHDVLQKVPEDRLRYQHHQHVLNERKEFLANYSMSYNDVINLGRQDGSSHQIYQALSSALEKTVDSYAESRPKK